MVVGDYVSIIWGFGVNKIIILKKKKNPELSTFLNKAIIIQWQVRYDNK